MNTKLKKSPFTIAAYVVAGILLVYAIYLLVAAVAYLNSYFTAYGTSIGENLKDSITYILGQAITPIVLACLTFMSGLILNEVRALNPANYVEVVAKAAPAPVAAPAAEAEAEAEPAETEETAEAEEAEETTEE